jgi:hypothetical protein
MDAKPMTTRSAALPSDAAATQRQRLIFLQMNEVNFDLVRRYLTTNRLPGFERLMRETAAFETFAESRYEELEPWIQWVSVHCGLRFAEHGVFRLGDAVHARWPQLFELMEQHGLKVGAISPMNARNELRQPAYFIPDPWTATPSDASGFSRRLTAMLQQTVNENAQQRVGLRSYLTICEAALRCFSWAGTSRLFKLILRTRGRQWVKALVLDQLIHLVHVHLYKTKQPNVSFVFLNAGAHIQHHYMFNSRFIEGKEKNPMWYLAPQTDPILEMLQSYDKVLDDTLDLCEATNARCIVATGLTQVPYDRVKYYYRLRDHSGFLALLGLQTRQVLPRMTRDFEVLLDSPADVTYAAETLRNVRLQRDGIALFEEIEERGNSVFVTLTYPHQILADDVVVLADGKVLRLFPHVAFVAIKNGMHSGRGFAFVSRGSELRIPKQAVHVSQLFGLALQAVGVVPAPPMASGEAAPAAVNPRVAAHSDELQVQ